MLAKSGVVGLITGVAGGVFVSLYIIYEALLHPSFDVLFTSLTTLENSMIIMVLTFSLGIFGFGIGYFLDKRNEKFKL
jgi:uncharacterized protein YneF (UPF0154 family)